MGEIGAFRLMNAMGFVKIRLLVDVEYQLVYSSTLQEAQ